MSPIINAEFVNSRMADLQLQAERHRMIHAARRARRARRDNARRARRDNVGRTTPRRTGSVLARRALAALDTRNPRPAR
jgi:hypothetical protein